LHPEQHSRVEFDEFRAALAKLPPDQREALILVGASGFSYEEAAAFFATAPWERSRAGSIGHFDRRWRVVSIKVGWKRSGGARLVETSYRWNSYFRRW
jgi:hypothetical protein